MLPIKAGISAPIDQIAERAMIKNSLKDSVESLKKAGVPFCMIGIFDFNKSPNLAKISARDGMVIIEDGVDYGLERTLRFSIKDKSVSDTFEQLSKETGIIFLQIDKNKHSSGLIVNIAESPLPMSMRDILAAIANTPGMRSVSLSPIKGPNVGKVLGFAVSFSPIVSIKNRTE